MAVANDLVKFSRNPVFDRPQPEVIHEAKRAVLDMPGCAVGVYKATPSRIMRELADRFGGKPEAATVGGGARASSRNAIPSNGAMAGDLDFYDTHPIAAGMDVAVSSCADRHGNVRGRSRSGSISTRTNL